MERIDYDLLFRWFVGLGMDDPVWNHSVFSKNRDRLMAYDVDELLFEAIKDQAAAKKLLSRDHFSADGTLIEACASLKSFKPKDQEDDSDDGENFHGKKRRNNTHESTTDPDSRMFRKGLGKEAKLNYMGTHRYGEPQRFRGWRDGDRSRHTAGVDSGDRTACRAAGATGTNGRSRQGLRRWCVRLWMQRTGHHTTRCSQEPIQPHRPADDAPPGLRDQPAQTETGRRTVRLDEVHTDSCGNSDIGVMTMSGGCFD